MCKRFLFTLILVVVPTAAFAQDDDAKAKAVAKEALDRGAALFDKREAGPMAATFVEAAQVILIKRSSDSGNIEVESRSGRPAIEAAYADIFKNRSPEHKARNTVESAKFLNPDLLLIQGKFALDAAQGDVIQFVQVRAREGDQWKVVTMQLMELTK